MVVGRELCGGDGAGWVQVAGVKADKADGMEATGGAQVGGLTASPPPRPPLKGRGLLL